MLQIFVSSVYAYIIKNSNKNKFLIIPIVARHVRQGSIYPVDDQIPWTRSLLSLSFHPYAHSALHNDCYLIDII
jgi:hypothetical protein